MNNYRNRGVWNEIFAILCIIAGLVIFIDAVGAFLLRLLYAVIGIFLISYGLRVRFGNTIFFWRWQR